MKQTTTVLGSLAAGALVTLALIWPMHEGARAAVPQDAGDEAAAMEAWMAAMNPGPAQQALATMVGSWKTTWQHVPAPGMPASEGTGTTRFEMLLGGRYLREETTGTSMGMPFHGIGLTAYDNAKGEWANVWIDNFGTGLTITRARAAVDDPMPEFKGSYFDPRFSADVPIRIVHEEMSADRMRMVMHSTFPGQAEYQSMQIEYVREAAAR